MSTKLRRLPTTNSLSKIYAINEYFANYVEHLPNITHFVLGVITQIPHVSKTEKVHLRKLAFTYPTRCDFDQSE